MNIITWPYRLRKGHSDNPADGACAMDAVNWLVHGEHGDAPQCACPVIAQFVIDGNDNMPDDIRQRLLAFLPRIAGSKSSAHEQIRARILVLAALRIFAPRALDAAGLHGHADTMRMLPDDLDMNQKAAAATAEAEAAARTAWASRAVAAWATAGATAGAAASRAAAAAAAWASRAAVAAWDDYFAVLDEALSAGPQGEPWSADAVERGTELYRASNGVAELVE